MSDRITYDDLPVKGSEKVKLTVTMEVTAAQAYALTAMFSYWTFCGKAGMSRDVAFRVDGDGNFQPNCNIKTDPELPLMPKDQINKSVVWEDGGNCAYDFDPIGWSLHP